jgi:hypothetical protein
MPTVYVVQQDPRKNFTTALQHGRISFVLPQEFRSLLDPAAALARIQEALALALPGDFLLPTGDPVAIAMAANVMDRRTGGNYGLLKWESGIYLPVQLHL